MCLPIYKRLDCKKAMDENTLEKAVKKQWMKVL